MLALPPAILSQYRAATSRDVRSWSFGALKSVRKQHAQNWHQCRGTLDDQGIFGPTRDYECACGKYRGIDYEKMICDRCGVKVTKAEARRARFGHIELAVQFSHPFVPDAQKLQAYPVLPGAFFQTPAGEALADAYDCLVVAGSPSEIETAITVIGEVLGPVVLDAHNWNLTEALTLARGLALDRREERASRDDRCQTCGYPLAGLTVASCPVCGRPLTS